MKQLFSKVTSICFALAMIGLSVIPAFAVDTTAKSDGSSNTLKINGDASVEVGKTVTYTLYLSDASDPVVGFEMRLFYDSDYLEYQPSSIKFEHFDAVIYNENIDGKIPMNYSALSNKPDFSKKSQFVSVDFKVKKAGESEISYFFTELYGDDMTYLKSFTFTYELAVGEESVVSDAVPPVNRDEDNLRDNQGDFINYADGKGENNANSNDTATDSKSSDTKAAVNSAAEGDAEEDGQESVISHEPVVDKNNTLSPYYQEEIVEVTRKVGGSDNSGSGGLSGGIIFLLIAVPVVIAAVVVALVLVNKKGKGSGGASGSEDSESFNSDSVSFGYDPDDDDDFSDSEE